MQVSRRIPTSPFPWIACGNCIEKSGIPTVSITLLRAVTERVRPPRALAVDRPLGYPLGGPHSASLQNRIILAALALLPQAVQEPLIVDFRDDE